MDLKPTMKAVVDLLLATEESSNAAEDLAIYIIGRDPATAPLLAELQQMALDAGLAIGNTHWTLSAYELNRQVDLLVRTDGRTWNKSAELLDPEGYLGIDHEGLISILRARIARGVGNAERLRNLRSRLIRESLE